MLATIVVMVGSLALAATASAFSELQFESNFGGQVNLTESGKGAALEDVCTVASGDQCGEGKEGGESGWFNSPRL